MQMNLSIIFACLWFKIGEYSELAPHEDVDEEASYDDEFDDEGY